MTPGYRTNAWGRWTPETGLVTHEIPPGGDRSYPFGEVATHAADKLFAAGSVDGLSWGPIEVTAHQGSINDSAALGVLNNRKARRAQAAKRRHAK